MESNGTIPEVLTERGFYVLRRLVEENGLLATLKDKGPFTVFAPIDTALENYDEKIKKILLGHVVKGSKLNGDDIKDGETKSIKSVGGTMITIKKENGVIHVYPGGAKVVKADIQATNGVIHGIDKLIIEPQGGTCSKDDDCMENEKCEGGKCTPTTSPECKSDADCSDVKKCLNGKCIKLGI